MNKFFAICLCALGATSFQVTYAQTPRKGQFSFFAGYGLSMPEKPKINVISGV